MISADGFWVLSLRSGVAGAPTSYLVDFDPTATPAALVAPMRALERSDVVEQFHKSTETFIETVDGLDDDAWSMLAESPFGHLPVRFVLAHAFWDSWLHERDIFVPLGIDVPVVPDELLLATWYSLLFGTVQGGLLDDPAPVGKGPSEPFEVTHFTLYSSEMGSEQSVYTALRSYALSAPKGLAEAAAEKRDAL